MPDEWIDKLFDKFMARYGSLFVDRFGGLPMSMVKAEWQSELAGYSARELHRGLEGCRSLRFPPTLPEFMQLCRPPIDAQSAHSEAVRNLALRARGDDTEWSHPAIFWAALDVGQFDLMNTSYPNIRNRWERALATQMDGREHAAIPPAMKPLPAPPTQPNPEVLATLRDLANKMKARR